MLRTNDLADTENTCKLNEYASTKQIIQALGISESKWKRDVKAGIYPRPKDFGGGSKRWKISELNDCVSNFPRC